MAQRVTLKPCPCILELQSSNHGWKTEYPEAWWFSYVHPGKFHYIITNTAGKIYYSFLQNIQTSSAAIPVPYLRSSFPGVRRLRREVDYSPPSSAVVKNGWSHTSTPVIWLHGVERDNFSLYVTSWVAVSKTCPVCDQTICLQEHVLALGTCYAGGLFTGLRANSLESHTTPTFYSTCDNLIHVANCAHKTALLHTAESFIEKLTFAKLVKQWDLFYGNWMSSSLFTTACQFSLNEPHNSNSQPSYPNPYLF
jgi:hypothetical protein